MFFRLRSRRLEERLAQLMGDSARLHLDSVSAAEATHAAIQALGDELVRIECTKTRVQHMIAPENE